MSQAANGPVPATRAGRMRRRLRLATALLSGFLLVGLMSVTLVDVVGRYLFNAPLPGASEYTELLLLATVYTGLPAICLDDGHITVDLLTGALTGIAATIQLFLARAFVAGALALIAWQLWAYADRIGLYDETTVFLRLPFSPVARAMAVLAGVSAAITALAMALRLPRSNADGIA